MPLWVDAVLAVMGGGVLIGWALTGRALLRLRDVQGAHGERLARLEAILNHRDD